MMEVKKNKLLEAIKTTLIFLLIIYACYQLVDMYGDFSVFQIFNFEKETKEDNEYYLKPESIMISFGNTDYVSINFDSNQDELVRSYLKDIYKEILSGKKQLDVSGENVTSILNTKSIIVCYGDYNMQMTGELFNVTNDKVLKLINKIDKVVIIPSETSEVKTKVYFIKNENAYFYETNIDTIELLGLIDEINLFSQMNIYKLSENTNYSKYFSKYIFIPEFNNDFSIFSKNENITISSPFVLNGEIDESSLEGYANQFFENPKAKWKMEKDSNVTIFGDGERTISIYKEGFANYSYTVMDDKDITLNDAIKVANEKINKDSYLNGYTKLVNARKISSNTYELSYDFYINNTKVILLNSIMNKYKVSYPLQVTVKSGIVSSYKALLCKFEDDNKQLEEDTEFNEETNKDNKIYEIKTFEEIMDELISIYPDITIKEFKLSYNKQNMYENASLKWIVDTSFGTFTYNAY